MKVLYFLVAKFFYSLGYFHGSSRIQLKISRNLPLKRGRVMHPLGFSWMISSRDALSTYLSSCEAFTTRIVLSRAASLDSFICVGANRGWYPLAVGAKNKMVRIVAFECNSSIFGELSQNVVENGNQSDLFKFAIGDQVAQKPLYMPKNGNEGMSTLYPSGEEKNEASIVELVNSTTLDVCLLDRFGTFGRSLILMDIEGSEMLALKGASKVLEDCYPSLILEINHELLYEAGTSSDELLAYLREYKYKVYWIDERGKLECVGKNNKLPHIAVLPPHTGANYLFVQEDELWVDKFVKV
jgi:FkbM family methyltransferase